MNDNNSNTTYTGTTNFYPSIENTTSTGGTVSDIYITEEEAGLESSSYVITLKELKACDGFGNVSQEQGEEIINTLYQLSTICYRRTLE